MSSNLESINLPRPLSRPGGLPLFAWVGPDNLVRGLRSFEDQQAQIAGDIGAGSSLLSGVSRTGSAWSDYLSHSGINQ